MKTHSDRFAGTDPVSFVEQCLMSLRKIEGTDLFLTTAVPPMVKVNGALKPIADRILDHHDTSELAMALMRDDVYSKFTESREANFAMQFAGAGRFRINAFIQRGSIGLVFREIKAAIPSLEELGVPPVLKSLVNEKRGLILIVGGSGAGKTSTLASLIDHRNHTTQSHIISLEDPIEFLHHPARSVVTQREIGLDTMSWESGLKNALRQAPDALVLGEVRDRTAMEYAMHFSETGHLALSTLHANSASQAIERVVNLFPEDMREQIWIDMSLNLKAVVCQRLVPREHQETGQKGRVAAFEVLINTPLVAKRLMQADVHGLRELMERGADHGMKTVDQSLFELYEEGIIRYEDALRFAESVNDLKLAIKLNSQRFKHEQDSTGPALSLL